MRLHPNANAKVLIVSAALERVYVVYIVRVKHARNLAHPWPALVIYSQTVSARTVDDAKVAPNGGFGFLPDSPF